MGLFKSLKGNHLDAIRGSNTQGDGDKTTPHDAGETRERHSEPQSFTQVYSLASSYVPPPGPPAQIEYAPPPGRPPPHWNQYASPPGPPSQRNQNIISHLVGHGEYAPHIGLPPSHANAMDEPPPYHDWTMIPDNALLPPPPSFGYETSPINNAHLLDADRAHEWCRRYPLMMPHQPMPAQHTSVNDGDVRPMRPREYRGDISMVNTGTWRGSTLPGSNDSCLVTTAPLYFAFSDSPLKTGVSKTIYFEVKIRFLGHQNEPKEGSIALGFCGMPYPTWRLPGWERGSLAVHGDDGRRYVSDTYGGIDFTSPFQVGDTIGLGMKFSLPATPPAYDPSPLSNVALKIEVCFTKNGRLNGGWNVHEELDSRQGIEGLDGTFDLYGALGTFGSVEFDCIFHRADWLWLPR